MVTQLFSFGAGQAFPNGYIKIKAPSKAAARAAMFRFYGPKWSMQYDEEEENKLIFHGLNLIEEVTVDKKV